MYPRFDQYIVSDLRMAVGNLRFVNVDLQKVAWLTLLLKNSRSTVYNIVLYRVDVNKGRWNYRSSSSASCERREFSISTACFQRREMTSGATIEYQIKAATTSLYPGSVAIEFAHIPMVIGKTSSLRVRFYGRQFQH
jgi:hypothetical protein